MGEACSCPPIRVPVNPGCPGLWDDECWGGTQQTTLCPTGTDLPCHRLPKGAPAPLLPSLVLLSNPRPALALLWQPWAHQLGHPHPALTALAPALAAQ